MPGTARPSHGMHAATGGIDLRFPGQWFLAEGGLYQNWMRDYDPTTEHRASRARAG